MWRRTSRSRVVSWSSSGSTSTGVERGERVEHEPGEPRREHGVAVRDPAHRVGQLDPGDGLGHVAARAGADDRDHVLGGIGDREREEPLGRSALGHLADDLEPAAAGHVHVEQDHVGLELDDQRHRLLDARGIAEHVDEPVELRPHTRAEERVVVHDHDARHGSITNSISVPCPGVLWIVARPP